MYVSCVASHGWGTEPICLAGGQEAVLPSFIRSSIRAERGGALCKGGRGWALDRGWGETSRSVGATPYHCLNQPLENICRDSELEESNNYFKGLVSEVGLYEIVSKWQEAD